MKYIEIIMRVISFCMGLFLCCATHFKIQDAGVLEILADTLLVLVWLAACVALLVLPWALPLRNK